MTNKKRRKEIISEENGRTEVMFFNSLYIRMYIIIEKLYSCINKI